MLPVRRHEHREVAEPGLARTLDQAERRARVGRDQRSRSPGQRGGDGPLVAGVDLEQRERQPLALLGECARGGRQSLALGERVLQRRQPLASEPGLFLQRLALGVRARAREQRLGAKPVAELARGVAPQLEPLDRAAQPVERRGRPVATACRGRELLLDAVALGQQRLEPLAGALALQARSGAPLLDLGQPLVDSGQVELGEASPQARDLAAQLLGPLGRGRLQRERPQPRLHLGLEVARALDLDLHARELQLGPVPAPLELAEAGRVLDQRAPLLRLRGEDLLDLALADHGAVTAAEPDVRQQLDQVGAADGGAVDQVLALAAAVQPARDRDLAEVELRQRAVLVVEQQLDLAEVGRRVAGRAGEEHVVRLLGAQLVRAQRAGGPEQRVGHVRLAGAVRPDHDRDPRLEANLDRFGERLEAAQLDRSQVHASGRLKGATDAAAPLAVTRPGPSPGSARATSSRPSRGGLSWTCCSTFATSSSSLSPRTVSPHGQSTFWAMGSSSSRSRESYAAPARRSSACFAASCSAAFFERPVPTPASSPSITAAHLKVRSCGGPWTSSTA